MSTITKYYCDVCHMETTPGNLYRVTLRVVTSEQTGEGGLLAEVEDVCSRCLEQTRASLQPQAVEAPPQEVGS